MTDHTPSPSAVGLRYGLITGFISIIYALILYLTELNTNTGLQWLGIVILVAGIVMAYNAFKKDNGGYMSYGQGLGIGTLVAIVSGVMGGIFNYVYTTYIDTTVTTRIRDMQIIEMEKRGLTDEQIEQGMAMAEKFSGPIMALVVSILVSAIVGFLISLVVSAIMKNNRPEFE